ncbi:MAG: ABC transporter permease [Clostridia bacterium]|nr:ABC transporter permease [Clostridia bacterium]
MQSKIKYTLKCLLDNKLRFFLTVLSLAVGVTSVLIINSVSEFGVASVSNELDSLGMNGLIVTSETDGITLTDNEAAKLNSIEEIEQVAPVTVNTSKVYSKNSENVSTMVWGIDERAEEVVNFELVGGRFINKGDIKSNSKVCMLDKSLAMELFGRENIIGSKLDLLCNSTVESFEVVGIVKTGKGIMQSLMGSYFPSFLYAPYTAFGSSPDYSQFFLKIDPNSSADAVTDLVKKELNGTLENEPYVVTDLASQKGVLENMLNIVTTILTVIGAISLLVSGISIMNIMLISVNERVKEIGIKKSIGATSRDILLDFLNESLIISVTGTLIGVVTSVIIIKAAAAVLGYNIAVSASSIIFSVALTTLLGVSFGIYPALKASKFKPVEALRR